MNAIANKDIPSAITTHYIDGAFVESHQPHKRPSDRPRHTGRRGGYAARNRRGQARIRDLRPVEEGRTRGDFAPTACGRFGARR
jgi:hypothetical protein